MNLKKYIKRINKLVGLDEMEILPGHLAFYLLFILIPVISFTLFIGNQINFKLTESFIDNNIPNAILILINETNIDFNNFNIIIYIILSLFLASRGTHAIIITSNLLFKIKDNNNFKIRIKSIIITIILFLLISFIILVPVLGDMIVSYLSKLLQETGLLIMTNIYHLLKYPISVLLIFILIKIIYTISPSNKIKSKYMNNGAIFTTITWLLLSRVYSFYLNNFNNYNLYYGNLSSILILLVWIYLLSYIFVIGLALNANNYLYNLKEKNS